MLDAPSASCSLASSIAARRSHRAASAAFRAAARVLISSPVEEVAGRNARAASRIAAMAASSPPNMPPFYGNTCSTTSGNPVDSGNFRQDCCSNSPQASEQVVLGDRRLHVAGDELVVLGGPRLGLD